MVTAQEVCRAFELRSPNSKSLSHYILTKKEKYTVEKYGRDGRSIRIGYRLRQLQNLQNLLVEKRTQLLNAIIVDLGASQDKNAIEEINILSVLKTIKLEYESLFREYKKTRIPNKIDLNSWQLSSSLIIGNAIEPLASLFIPLVYAISAGTPAVFKLDKGGRLEAVLYESVSKYLDSEIYVYSESSVDQLRDLNFDKVVSTIGQSGTNDRASGVNVVAIVDTELSIGQAISEIIKWKEILHGKTLSAPDVVLVHELHFQSFLDAAEGSQSFKVKVLDDPFAEFPRSSNRGVLNVAIGSTETVILLLQSRKVKLFTYLGSQSFGEYILKFAPQVKTGSVNEIRLVFYHDIDRTTFQDKRCILTKRNLTSNLSDALTTSSYEKTRLPRLPIKYEKNMGFFEQGFLISLGFIGLSTVSLLSFSLYYFFKK